MTFLQLQNLVLSWLDDLNAGYFTLPQVKVWLNNALRELQKQLIQAGENWYLTCATTSLVANQDCYSLPSDFLKEHRLRVMISGTISSLNTATLQTILPATPMQSNYIQVGPGTPAIYFLKKNCVVLKPVPDTAKTLVLDYSYRVSDMVYDNETPDAPSQYHEYLAVLAACDGFLKDGRDPSPFLEKRNTYLALMKQDAKNRNVDVPRMVRTLADDDYGFIY